MVRGNTDRRRELASRRREDQKNEQERKALGASHATPTEVRARILNDAKTRNLIPKAYIKDLNNQETKLFCVDFVRCGVCDTKRCRFSHEFSLAMVKGMPQIQDSRGMAPLLCVDLATVNAGDKLVYDRTIRTKIRQQSPIQFIVMGDEIVFDADFPIVFQRYCEQVAEANLLQMAEEMLANQDSASDFE